MDNPSSIYVENLWNDLRKPLKGFINKHIKNNQDADDILQNVFYKIHNNIGSLKDTEKLNSWVYAIARNAITDFYREHKYDALLTELPDDLTDYQTETNANEEIAECLKTMIQYLPEKYKSAIILTEFQNLTQKELSERMGLSLSGAKSRVQRARLKLKEMLLACCSLEFDHFGNVVEYQHKNENCKFC